MYEHWTVGNDTTTSFLSITSEPGQVAGSAPLADRALHDDDYILFVHGWNQDSWDRRDYASTAFKRLYWQNYTGQFGLFSWPTDANMERDPTNFPRSEQRAYHSALGLRNLLGDLNERYPQRVRMMAHSMGNVVASEALRLATLAPEPPRIVHTYVASQAAMGADAYSAFVPRPDGYEQLHPEVYRFYPPTNRPYFADVDDAVETNAEGRPNVINYYNKDDSALWWWDWNQASKPVPEFGYHYNVFADFSYSAGLGHSRPLTFPAETYEIFAWGARASARAAGTRSNLGGPFDVTRQRDLDAEPYSYGELPAGHSAQFLNSNISQQHYWNHLLKDFGLL